MDMEEEKEEAVDLWLLAKTLKKKGISSLYNRADFMALQEFKIKTNVTKVMVKNNSGEEFPQGLKAFFHMFYRF